MGAYGNGSCLQVLLYVTNALLIVKGVLWIAFDIFTYLDLYASFVRYEMEITSHVLLFVLPMFSILFFGIASLLYGIIGVVLTSKKHSPTLIATAVLLILLFLAEVAIYAVLGAYGTLSIILWELWVGVVGAVLTLVTFSLTVAWKFDVKEDDYE